jgi:hypothetical protein
MLDISAIIIHENRNILIISSLKPESFNIPYSTGIKINAAYTLLNIQTDKVVNAKIPK